MMSIYIDKDKYCFILVDIVLIIIKVTLKNTINVIQIIYVTYFIIY